MMNVMWWLKFLIVILMYWFGCGILDSFFIGMFEDFVIVDEGVNDLEVFLCSLLDRLMIMVL